MLNPAPAGYRHAEVEGPISPEAADLRIQIPLDIHQVKTASPAEAAEWRSVTRSAFLHCFERGYRVVAFYRDDTAERGYYLLTRVDVEERGG